jgi:hypothetical protein
VTERHHLAALLVLAACGSDPPPPLAEPEHDAGMHALDAGAQHDAGMDASVLDAGSEPDASPPPFVKPAKLSETGLYADLASDELAPGVMPYRPRFELWSDGATKRRYLYLPEGTQIDSSDMDHWVFPVGTKVWKEFTRDGVRVETRLLQKTGEDEWFMMPFVWTDDESDALATPEGLSNARGTAHDVPKKRDCGECHDNVSDRLLGVSAIQLAHHDAGLNLSSLAERLTTPAAAELTLPGDRDQQKALGYLHANCGHCHNDLGDSAVYRDVDLVFWLRTTRLGSLEDTLTYETTVGKDVGSINSPDDSPAVRIQPGDPEHSAVLFRMLLDTSLGSHMPPLASKRIDEDNGVARVRAFIDGLE